MQVTGGVSAKVGRAAVAVDDRDVPRDVDERRWTRVVDARVELVVTSVPHAGEPRPASRSDARV